MKKLVLGILCTTLLAGVEAQATQTDPMSTKKLQMKIRASAYFNDGSEKIFERLRFQPTGSESSWGFAVDSANIKPNEKVALITGNGENPGTYTEGTELKFNYNKQGSTTLELGTCGKLPALFKNGNMANPLEAVRFMFTVTKEGETSVLKCNILSAYKGITQ
jgi:hypothetical protein